MTEDQDPLDHLLDAVLLEVVEKKIAERASRKEMKPVRIGPLRRRAR